MTDGQWTDQKLDLIPVLLLPFEGARIQRARITKQDNDEFGPLLDVLVEMQSMTTKDTGPFRSLQSASARMFQKNSTRSTKIGSKNELISEALAEEVHRGDERQK